MPFGVQALSKITSTGAMTFCFIQAIEHGQAATYGNILNSMRNIIRSTGSGGGGGGGAVSSLLGGSGGAVTSLVGMLLTGGSVGGGGLRQVLACTAFFLLVLKSNDICRYIPLGFLYENKLHL